MKSKSCNTVKFINHGSSCPDKCKQKYTLINQNVSFQISMKAECVEIFPTSYAHDIKTYGSQRYITKYV